MFGKTSASPRMRGTRAARSSGANIELKRQGLSLHRLWSNGSSARAVGQLLLHQLRVRRWRWQMESCNTKTIRNSERDLGRLGWPARLWPEARLLGAGGASLPSGSRFCRLHGGGGVAVDDWNKHLQNAFVKRVGNQKLERICKKLDQISQKLESN